MRVAVHFAKDDPQHPKGVAAYRLGRIVDGEHNFRVDTGELTPIDEFVANLVKQAQHEYPDAEVVVERLVQSGEGEGKWIPADEFDPEKHQTPTAGQTVGVDATAGQGTEAG